MAHRPTAPQNNTLNADTHKDLTETLLEKQVYPGSQYHVIQFKGFRKLNFAQQVCIVIYFIVHQSS